MKVVLVDYGMGNLNSVKRKLERIGARVVVSSDNKIIERACKIVLPGVGHFAKAVNNLKNLFLWDTLNTVVLEKGIPILGICLGMQLMTQNSEEGNEDGFGWFNANVVHFEVKDQLKFKIPHMGWNSIISQKSSDLLAGLPPNPEFYFVHSYHVISKAPNEVLTTTNYEYEFVSALEKDNIFGLQFHPEKSHDVGEKLLSNFLKI